MHSSTLLRGPTPYAPPAAPRATSPRHRPAEADGALRVSRFDGPAAEWDAFVAEAEGSTFCHLAGWREIMSDVLGHECIYLVARDGAGRWQGVLPLVRVNSLIFGHYLVSMPFLNYGGPLGTPAARAALAEWAVAEAKRSGLKLMELRTREADDDARAAASLTVSARKVTVLLDLAETPELLFKRFPSKLRSQIRRPQKEGMELRVGADQVGAFYEVFARNMRDLGTPVLPKALFERIARVFGERALFAAVYHEGAPVAAGCGFLWGDEFEITWASSLREHNAKSPNMLLYWGLMEHLVGRGAKVFNFGRCTPGGPTHKFKLQWGGRDVPLPWLQFTPNAGAAAAAAATPNPDAGGFGLAVRAWQRLPLPVANLVGPFLARQIP